MLKKSYSLFLLLLFFSLQPTISFSQELITSSNLDQIIKIARNFGSATLAKQSDGAPMIIGKIDNIPYRLRFRNCTEQTICQDMNFRVGFLIKPNAEIINSWNKEKRFSKAYLDDDKDAIIEWDVVISGGISSQSLEKTFSYWRLTLSQFTKHIGFK
jgi:hypothetical protein